MNSDVQVAIIAAASPVILAIIGGVGWLIRHLIISARENTATPGVSMGNRVEVHPLAAYLEKELDDCLEESRAYRDALIRKGVDPDAVLRDSQCKKRTIKEKK